jgi:hypothetical protein
LGQTPPTITDQTRDQQAIEHIKSRLSALTQEQYERDREEFNFRDQITRFRAMGREVSKILDETFDAITLGVGTEHEKWLPDEVRNVLGRIADAIGHERHWKRVKERGRQIDQAMYQRLRDHQQEHMAHDAYNRGTFSDMLIRDIVSFRWDEAVLSMIVTCTARPFSS